MPESDQVSKEAKRLHKLIVELREIHKFSKCCVNQSTDFGLKSSLHCFTPFIKLNSSATSSSQQLIYVRQASMQSEPCSVGACLTLNSHNLAKLCPFVKPWSKSKSKPLSQQTPKLNKRIWLEGFGLRAGTKIILATTTTTYPTPNFLCMKECSGGYKTPLSSIGIFLCCNSCHQWNSFVEELFKCTGWLLKMPKTIWAWERIILSYF